MNAIYSHKIETAMATALTKLYAEHPEVDGIALDTVRHFAAERFEKACTPAKIEDSRFDVEGPRYAYYLLLQETATLAKAIR